MNRPTPHAAAHRRLTAAVAATAGAALLLSGCTQAANQEAAAGPPPPPMSITIRPADDAGKVGPDARIAVKGTHGTLNDVQVVDSDGDSLAGRFNRSHTRWRSTEDLEMMTGYAVSAAGLDGVGRTVTETSRFVVNQIPPGRALHASAIAPLEGSTVGVAQPLVVRFDHPVANRQAVQDALTVTADRPIDGAWYWIDDSSVHYRPKTFWPANTEVSINAELKGVDAGDGFWGAANRRVSYDIGRRQVIKIDVNAHTLKVVRGGRTLKTFPVSTGKPGWETRNGIKVLMSKVEDKKWTDEAIDADEDYTLYSDHAMRMTNSGEFIHDAPWNVGHIGETNASHGCAQMNPDDMDWLWDHSIVGDPIVVTGSPREFEHIWNRYMDWNLSWSKWSAGNA